MAREEHLKFCKVCKNRSTHTDLEIVCSLTNKIAVFDDNCENFSEDFEELDLLETDAKVVLSEKEETVNNGRNILFIIGGFYFLFGFYQAFISPIHSLSAGVFDWFLSVIFIGLGFWSYKMASTALILALSFYSVLILLMGMIDPFSILNGALFKILTFIYLIKAIQHAKENKIKNKIHSGDLLDQI